MQNKRAKSEEKKRTHILFLWFWTTPSNTQELPLVLNSAQAVDHGVLWTEPGLTTCQASLKQLQAAETRTLLEKLVGQESLPDKNKQSSDQSYLLQLFRKKHHTDSTLTVTEPGVKGTREVRNKAISNQHKHHHHQHHPIPNKKPRNNLYSFKHRVLKVPAFFISRDYVQPQLKNSCRLHTINMNSFFSTSTTEKLVSDIHFSVVYGVE